MAAKETLSTKAKELEEFFERKNINTAPPWIPEAGSVMAATVVGLRMGADSGYGPYPIVVYRTDDGTFVSVHAFHTLLRKRLEELGTAINKRQILSYDGKRRKNNASEEDVKAGKADYHFYYVENAGENDAMGADENFKF